MQTTAPFTIKHVMRDGAVALYAARAITIRPASGDVGTSIDPNEYYERPPALLEFDMGDGSGVRGSIRTGKVYVLNQNAKTVDQVVFPSHQNADEDEPTGLMIAGRERIAQEL